MNIEDKIEILQMKYSETNMKYINCLMNETTTADGNQLISIGSFMLNLLKVFYELFHVIAHFEEPQLKTPSQQSLYAITIILLGTTKI